MKPYARVPFFLAWKQCSLSKQKQFGCTYFCIRLISQVNRMTFPFTFNVVTIRSWSEPKYKAYKKLTISLFGKLRRNISVKFLRHIKMTVEKPGLSLKSLQEERLRRVSTYLSTSKTMTSSDNIKDITEGFNSFYVNIGQSLQDNLSSPEKSFMDFMGPKP